MRRRGEGEKERRGEGEKGEHEPLSVSVLSSRAVWVPLSREHITVTHRFNFRRLDDSAIRPQIRSLAHRMSYSGENLLEVRLHEVCLKQNFPSF